jgi:hypothetical protein
MSETHRARGWRRLSAFITAVAFAIIMATGALLAPAAAVPVHVFGR